MRPRQAERDLARARRAAGVPRPALRWASPPLYVLAGAAPALTPAAPAWIDPPGASWEHRVAEHAADLIGIVSLAGAGFAIDRPASWRCRQVAWRLPAIVMPLAIAGIAVGGLSLGLPLASATLAPTDPVLASSVRAGRPPEGGRVEVRLGPTEGQPRRRAGFPLRPPRHRPGRARGGGEGGGFEGWPGRDLLCRVAAAGRLLARIVVCLGDARRASADEGEDAPSAARTRGSPSSSRAAASSPSS